MYFQIIIALILLLSILGIWVCFFVKNRLLLQKHTGNILELESKISRNRLQIDLRNANLSRYHFLKYNLNDALIVQVEISV